MDVWKAVAVTFSTLVFFIVYLRGFKIEIEKDILKWRNRFYRTKTLKISSIRSANVRFVKISYFIRDFQFIRLVIKKNNNTKTLINISAFSPETVKLLLQILNSRKHNEFL
jgi:hypothetical protein